MIVEYEKLVEQVARSLRMDQSVIDKVLDQTLQKIKTMLVQKKQVRIKRFGSFRVIGRAARRGRNPQTGEMIDISARLVVRFEASSILTYAVRKQPVPSKNKPKPVVDLTSEPDNEISAIKGPLKKPTPSRKQKNLLSPAPLSILDSPKTISNDPFNNS